jgi:hypothetical protein
MKKAITVIFVFMLLSNWSGATVIEVPNDYPTIQQAINAAADGDTIIVFPDIYYENINFREKNLILTSLYYQDADIAYINSTIIDGSTPGGDEQQHHQ